MVLQQTAELTLQGAQITLLQAQAALSLGQLHYSLGATLCSHENCVLLVTFHSLVPARAPYEFCKVHAAEAVVAGAGPFTESKWCQDTACESLQYGGPLLCLACMNEKPCGNKEKTGCLNHKAGAHFLCLACMNEKPCGNKI